MGGNRKSAINKKPAITAFLILSRSDDVLCSFFSRASLKKIKRLSNPVEAIRSIQDRKHKATVCQCLIPGQNVIKIRNYKNDR
jgi:hypothetical protein